MYNKSIIWAAPLLIILIHNIAFSNLPQTDTPPAIPVGLDAYTMWDRLPYQRIGIRAYMRSTYDRRGENRRADAGNFLYQQSEDFNVALDVKGQPGILYFKRTNHWHGSPWHYEVDGNDFIVKETSTADPVNAKNNNQFPVQTRPATMLEFEFEAGAGTPYAIWIRGKNLDGSNFSDALWLQFDENIGQDHIDAEYYHEKGFGNWNDQFAQNEYGWSSVLPGLPPETVTFKSSGKHRLRVQPRQSGHIIDQIWLSTGQKTNPDFRHPVKNKTHQNDIILSAANVINLKGRIQVISDPDASSGKALLIEKTPRQPSVFIPENLFPHPLTWTWSDTKGADLMWVPIPFEESFRMAYSRTYYGTGYYIYHLMTEGMPNLSQAIQTWQKEPPDCSVLDLLRSAGTDIAPRGSHITTHAGTLHISPYQWTLIQEIQDAPAMIRALKFTVPRNQAYAFGQARLKVTWDNRWAPSIDVPVALFFGAGHLYNNNDREFLVKGLPANIRYDSVNVHLGFYYPMPFFKNARIEIQGQSSESLDGIHYEIRSVDFNDPINTVSYFHATYSDHPHPKLGEDITFLDTQNVEGGGDWSGTFLGMSWIFSHKGVLNTLEGDPRFFFDDSRTPQGWGTGTEEWGGGGDYWGGQNMTLPLAGYPVGTHYNRAANDLDLLNSAYRFLIADHFPFGKNARINLEHGGLNDSEEHYEGVVYWYGINQPTLVQTDMLNVCDQKSIKEHNYQSPSAGQPYELVSRYEWGRDSDTEGRMYYPAEQDSVRIMRGTSTFEVDLVKNNLGVLLRRKFDYAWPNQTARIYVKPAGSKADWKRAGIWYTAGSNTAYFSYPKEQGELAKSDPLIYTSNRQWREEEFLISPALTQNVKKLAVKIEWIPDNRPLLPNQPFPNDSAWSSSRYWVYCYQMPRIEIE